MTKGRNLRPRKISSYVALLTMVVASTCFCGCQGGVGSTGGAGQMPSSPTPATAFERDLNYIRQGHFAHVYIFSRKDAAPIDKDDAAYLRQNAPKVVDWVSTDDGRRVIAGTNFELEPGNVDALRKKFNIEDYSGK